MDRRNFIKKTGLTFSALPLYSATFQIKPYKIILIGSGWWGMNILREAIAYGNCKIVAICNVDRSARETARTEVEKLNGDKPKLYNDFRELISKEKADITIIATPDHWHVIPAITAIKNGSHIYIEKPISHTIEEGRAILDVARANGRTVQVGTHRRNSPHNIAGMELLRSGKVGQVNQVKTFVNYRQSPGTPQPDIEAPNSFDWDF